MGNSEDREAEIQRVTDVAARLARLMNRHFVVDPDKARDFAKNTNNSNLGVASTTYDAKADMVGYLGDRA